MIWFENVRNSTKKILKPKTNCSWKDLFFGQVLGEIKLGVLFLKKFQKTKKNQSILLEMVAKKGVYFFQVGQATGPHNPVEGNQVDPQPS